MMLLGGPHGYQIYDLRPSPLVTSLFEWLVHHYTKKLSHFNRKKIICYFTVTYAQLKLIPFPKWLQANNLPNTMNATAFDTIIKDKVEFL